MPAFAQAWAAAVDDGHARLELLLMERGAALIGGVERGGPDGSASDGQLKDWQATSAEAKDGEARAAFDPHIAMWLIKRRDQIRAGTVKRGPGQRRDPSGDEVTETILRRLAAMKRAETRKLEIAPPAEARAAAAGSVTIEAAAHRRE